MGSLWGPGRFRAFCVNELGETTQVLKVGPFLTYVVILLVLILFLQPFRSSPVKPVESALSESFLAVEKLTMTQFNGGREVRKVSADEMSYSDDVGMKLAGSVEVRDYSSSGTSVWIESNYCHAVFDEGLQNMRGDNLKHIHFHGNARLRSGDVILKSEEIRYDISTKRLFGSKAFTINNELGWLSGAGGFEYSVEERQLESFGSTRGEGRFDASQR